MGEDEGEVESGGEGACDEVVLVCEDWRRCDSLDIHLGPMGGDIIFCDALRL